MYVNNFMLVSEYQIMLDQFKESLKSEYNIEDLEEIKTIIGWQVIQNLDVGILIIKQSALIQDLLREKNLADCNSVNIPIKTRSFIKILKPDDYKKADLKTY